MLLVLVEGEELLVEVECHADILLNLVHVSQVVQAQPVFHQLEEKLHVP
jgi:hypothetical protein